MKDGKNPEINGDGSFSRDFTYIDNVVQANLLAMFSSNSKIFGKVINIGAGGQTSILDLFNIIKQTLNLNIEPVFKEIRKGDVAHSNADITKAKNILGYEPKILFNEGIIRTIEYFNKKINDKILLLEHIDFNKLLNRVPIEVNNEEVYKYLKNNKILITGGCGSIGSEVVRQLLEIGIDNLIVYDNYECGIFNLKQELVKKYKICNLKFVLGDINDVVYLKEVYELYKPEFVFHCAAYKHVNIMENNMNQAIRVNIIGSKNVADLAIINNVKKFIMVSTDKAVNPTSVMGCSKRISELYMNYLNKQQNNTEFIITRFGNVLGSNGSVIPTFISNINNNEPIKITHPDVIRYFMTIPEASKLILQASMIGNAGEILLFNMGNPVKIYDLALNMVKFYSDKKIDVIFTNLEKGEKLYEELLCIDENIIPTENKNIMKLKNSENIDLNDFINKFNFLINNNHNKEEIINSFKNIVAEYN
jgi:FlaA1/EpsC-like NDP-sugar epimerase